MTIHVWVPDYASAGGGIQAFSRFLVRALRELHPSARIHVICKNDTSSADPGADWCTAFTTTGWWPVRMRTWAFIEALWQAARREQPDLIITTHVNFAPVARYLQGWFGIPYLAVGHGIDVWSISRGLLPKALRAATRLVAVSEFTRCRMAAALALGATRITILPNTFDPTIFLGGPKPAFLLRRFGLRRDQPVVLTTGSDGPASYKGYDRVIRVLPGVRERFPDVRYILTGKGSQQPGVTKLVRELGLAESVILAGHIPEHELCTFYNLCDVFAMPSKGEGFGIVFLEALACGKPVLAGNKDGSIDAVLGGQIGALVDPDDLDEIEATLIRLLNGTHPNAILRDPQQLRRRVIEAYGYEKFKQRLSEILEPLLEEK